MFNLVETLRSKSRIDKVILLTAIVVFIAFLYMDLTYIDNVTYVSGVLIGVLLVCNIRIYFWLTSVLDIEKQKYERLLTMITVGIQFEWMIIPILMFID